MYIKMKFNFQRFLQKLRRIAILQCVNKINYFKWNVFLPIILCINGAKTNRKQMLAIYKILLEENVTSVRISSTNTVTAIFNNCFLKIPLTKKSNDRLLNEYNRWLTASSMFPQIIINSVCLCQNNGWIYLKMPILDPLMKEDELKASFFLLNYLQRNRTCCNGFVTNNIKTAFSILNNKEFEVTLDVFQKKFTMLWSKNIVWQSPTHGDFWPGNIMLYNGAYTLIDMDRFEKKGVAIFDVLHLYFATNKIKRKSWMAQLTELSYGEIVQFDATNCVLDYTDKEWLIIKIAYWLDRIGNENSYENVNSTLYKEDVVSTYLHFYRALLAI